MSLESTKPLKEAIAELGVLAWQMGENPEPETVSDRLPRLRELLGLMTYLSGKNFDGWNMDESPRNSHVKCSNEFCRITSAVPDACLLNFAKKDQEPVWFCRDHHPKHDIKTPGWQVPEIQKQDKLERQRSALAKLTPEERKLVNVNMV